MTSERRLPGVAPRRAPAVYVWAWLPGATVPVVAGGLAPTGRELYGESVLAFRYARSYLERADSISLYAPELPLTDDTYDPAGQVGRDPVALASCLRDAAPDAWGRRVINLQTGREHESDEVTYLLRSGSNRTGAVDFQVLPHPYVARNDAATLDELLQLTDLVEAGHTIPAALAAAAQHGTSIGGARPKAMLTKGPRQLIAKFSTTTDSRPVVQAEAVAVHLARLAGLTVPGTELITVRGRHILLIDRFDRVPAGAAHGADSVRRPVVSLLTVLGLAEMNARHASYADLAAAIRSGPWADPRADLTEMFSRLVFNICIGNNDDHLRNHAAFWDGAELRLTPAYDLAPQIRSTDPSSQAIAITRAGDRASQLRLARAVAAEFHLSAADADDIIDRVRGAIVTYWQEACDLARLTVAERAGLWGREFLNPYIDYDET